MFLSIIIYCPGALSQKGHRNERSAGMPITVACQDRKVTCDFAKKQSESYACSHSTFLCFQNCEWPVGRCLPESQVLRFPSWDVSIQQQVPFPKASMMVSSQLSLDSAVSWPPFLCCSCPGSVRRRPITVLSLSLHWYCWTCCPLSGLILAAWAWWLPTCVPSFFL